MNIYKLQYKDKETAMADLLAKKVYIKTEEVLSYGSGIQAIVEIIICTYLWLINSRR
jgi:hypothetical protein